MKTESFDKLIESRFSKEELAAIKQRAALEVSYIHQIKTIIQDSLKEYSIKNNVKIDEIAKELGWSKSKMLKLENGEYNLGLADFGRLLATLKKDPVEIFKTIKKY